jgi:hypothetical protein
MFTREKGFVTISFNYQVIFLSKNLEKPAIFENISMNFHENFYRKIKTIRPECNGDHLIFHVKNSSIFYEFSPKFMKIPWEK